MSYFFNNRKIMYWEEIFIQLSLWMVNFLLKSYAVCFYSYIFYLIFTVHVWIHKAVPESAESRWALSMTAPRQAERCPDITGTSWAMLGQHVGRLNDVRTARGKAEWCPDSAELCWVLSGQRRVKLSALRTAQSHAECCPDSAESRWVP